MKAKTKRMDSDGNARPQGYRVYDITGDIPALGLGGGIAGASCLINDTMSKDKILRWQNKKDGIVESDTAPTLRSSGGTDIRKRPVVINVNENAVHQQDRVYDPNGIMPSLSGGTHGNAAHLTKIKVIQKRGGYGSSVSNDETGTLQGGGDNVIDKVPNIYIDPVAIDLKTASGKSATRRGGVSKTNVSTLDHNCYNGISNNSTIRRLTEIECERLQGYKDGWTEYGIYEKQVWINKKEKTFEIVQQKHKIPRTQRYKLCGNAVTVDVVEMIGRKLLGLEL